MDTPNISVITVCLNSKKEIKRTLESVLAQDYSDYEYIIVDGKSIDGTLKIINRYCPAFQKKGISVRVISEKDTGIYNAMNKGVWLASGKWIVFMNAGDCFFEKNTLSKAAEYCTDDTEYGIVYGNCVGEKYNLYKTIESQEYSKITDYMPFCHQSAYTKKELLQKNPFDEKYKIAADHDFFLKFYLSNGKWKKVDDVLCIFCFGGVSNKNEELTRREVYKIQYSHNLISKSEYDAKVLKLDSYVQPPKDESLAVSLLRRIVPKLVRKIRWIFYTKKSLKKNGWVKKKALYR